MMDLKLEKTKKSECILVCCMLLQFFYVNGGERPVDFRAEATSTGAKAKFTAPVMNPSLLARLVDQANSSKTGIIPRKAADKGLGAVPAAGALGRPSYFVPQRGAIDPAKMGVVTSGSSIDMGKFDMKDFVQKLTFPDQASVPENLRTAQDSQVRQMPATRASVPTPDVAATSQKAEGLALSEAITPAEYVQNRPSQAMILDPTKIAIVDAHPIQNIENSTTYGGGLIRHGNRMIEPVRNYIDALATKYKDVAQIVPELFTTYIKGFLDEASSDRSAQYVADYNSYNSWSIKSNLWGGRYNSQNLSMGLKFLDSLYKDPEFKIYIPTYQDESMSAPMSEYFKVLRESHKYAHIPDVILSTYITEYLDESQTTKPQDLLNDPVLPTDINQLTNSQKIYLTMQSIEKINGAHADAYKSPGGTAVEPTTLQGKIDAAMQQSGDADRLLLKSGINVGNLLTPTPAEMASVAATLAKNNPSFTAFKDPKANLEAKRVAFEQLQVDFVLFNQDILVLKTKIEVLKWKINNAVEKNPADQSLQKNYELILQQAQKLRDQMNVVIVQQQVTDYMSNLVLTQNFSIDAALLKFNNDPSVTLFEPADKNNLTMQDIMDQQAQMKNDKIGSLLAKIQKQLELSRKGTPDKDLIDAQTQLDATPATNPEGKMMWTKVRDQLKVEKDIADRLNVIINAKATELWNSNVSINQDPLAAFFKDLRDAFRGKDAMLLKIQRIEDDYTHVRIDLDQFSRALNAVSAADDMAIYTGVLTKLKVNLNDKAKVITTFETSQKSKSIDQQLKEANAKKSSATGDQVAIWQGLIIQLEAKKAESLNAAKENLIINAGATQTTDALWNAYLQDNNADPIAAALVDFKVKLTNNPIVFSAVDTLVTQYNLLSKRDSQQAMTTLVGKLNDLIRAHGDVDVLEVYTKVLQNLEVKINNNVSFLGQVADKLASLKQGNSIEQAVAQAEKDSKTPAEARNKVMWDEVLKQLKIDQIAEKAVVNKNSKMQKQATVDADRIWENQDPIGVALKELRDKLTGTEQAAIKKLFKQYGNDTITSNFFSSKLSFIQTVNGAENLDEKVVLILDDMSKKANVSADLQLYTEIIKQLQLKIVQDLRSSATIADIVDQLMPAKADQTVTAKSILLGTNIEWVKAKLEKLQPTGERVPLTKEVLKTEIKDFTDKLGDKKTTIKTEADLIKTYTDLLKELERQKELVDKDSKFNQAYDKWGQALQTWDVRKAVSGTSDVAAGVGESVWAGLDAMGLKKENFSPATLLAIATIITSISGLLIKIQQNQNLTDEQRRKMQDDAFSAGFQDILTLAIADQTGADANVLASGNLTDMAISSGSNQLIKALMPKDSTSLVSTSGGYQSNLSKYEQNYDALVQQSVRQKIQQRLSPGSSNLSKITNGSAARSNSSYSSPYASSYPSYNDLLAMES